MTANRTQEERDWWVAYSEDQKRDVLRRCAQREHVMRSGKGDLAPSMGIVESRRKGSRKRSREQQRSRSMKT